MLLPTKDLRCLRVPERAPHNSPAPSRLHRRHDEHHTPGPSWVAGGRRPARCPGTDCNRVCPGPGQGFGSAHHRHRQQGQCRVHEEQRQQDPRLAELRPGLRRDAPFEAQPDQHVECERSGPGVVVQPGIQAGRGVHAAGGRRHHVRHRVVERGARGGRAHGPTHLDLRPAGAARSRLQGLLRRGQPWRGVARRQGLRGRLRRPPDRAGRGHRQGRVGKRHHHRPQVQLHHHRCTARVQGQRDHRQRRRRVRRARLHHRLRREEWCAEMALVHRAGRPEQTV
ncbi:quinohemoethanol dehydrogenase type-1 domain protein [Hydrogenophaga sp. RAC07]|nr:quinohemoethanol dehydrogenase type-1 domain protein [Hydrogenophaga sp. RAC07]